MDSVEDIQASLDRFPYSEICGSKSARLSPQLIAACYVLHRLCAPRHPPDALALTLDRSAFVPCPERRPALSCSRTIATCPFPGMVLMRSVLSVVFKINRLCIRSIPPFTMSEIMIRKSNYRRPNQEVCPSLIPSFCAVRSLQTAISHHRWWSRSGSNRRPQACKASALPTELRPRSRLPTQHVL
jgi:hypothetical protein